MAAKTLTPGAISFSRLLHLNLCQIQMKADRKSVAQSDSANQKKKKNKKRNKEDSVEQKMKEVNKDAKPHIEEAIQEAQSIRELEEESPIDSGPSLEDLSADCDSEDFEKIRKTSEANESSRDEVLSFPFPPPSSSNLPATRKLQQRHSPAFTLLPAAASLLLRPIRVQGRISSCILAYQYGNVPRIDTHLLIRGTQGRDTNLVTMLRNDDDEHHSVTSESNHEVEESDSSEDEVAPRNTVGDVPLEWYRDEKHVGYDIAGKKITKKERQDKLDSFLASFDDPKNWLKIHDDYNDEEVIVTKEELGLIRRMIDGQAPHADFDPYAPYVDWFKWDGAGHPLSSAPEPKRRFIPSKSEMKKVVQYVRAIREGRIKLDKPKEDDQRFYLLWEDNSSSEKTKHLAYIPPPKPKLPGHEESYNPSVEYIPTQEEVNSYQLMYEEDRPKFIPTSYSSLRAIPAYADAIKDSFERCLDLYLCPRVRKKRINIDPESLKPKLPNRKDLRPYPAACFLEYKGHGGAVVSVSVDPSGQWIASGSVDGTVRVWEVETGKCLRVWDIGEAVKQVAWNPVAELPILAVSAGADVLLLNTEFGSEEEQKKVKELLQPRSPNESDEMASVLDWVPDERYGGIKLRHFKTVSSVEWHRRGDYLSTVMPAAESRAVLIHQLTKGRSQKLPFKLHGIAVTTIFHPSRSVFFVATKKNVRVYDLVKAKLVKKLETGLREISSIAVHPAGDNVIVGSKDGKLCWFDMDLSSRPYKTLKCHSKDITQVAFHRSYPLFASSSDDCSACVFHGMVYSDLNQNPLLVPLDILRGHTNSNGRGVLDCKFHPRQPWLFTAGADSLIKLFCH